MGSAGGFSWQGSFDQAHEEQEDGVDRKRMSSAMKPGGVTFEKGKWVRNETGRSYLRRGKMGVLRLKTLRWLLHVLRVVT